GGLHDWNSFGCRWGRRAGWRPAAYTQAGWQPAPRAQRLNDLSLGRTQDQGEGPANDVRVGGRGRAQGGQEPVPPRRVGAVSPQQFAEKGDDGIEITAAPVALRQRQRIERFVPARQTSSDQGGRIVGPADHRLGRNPGPAAGPAADVGWIK